MLPPLPSLRSLAAQPAARCCWGGRRRASLVAAGVGGGEGGEDGAPAALSAGAAAAVAAAAAQEQPLAPGLYLVGAHAALRAAPASALLRPRPSRGFRLLCAHASLLACTALSRMQNDGLVSLSWAAAAYRPFLRPLPPHRRHAHWQPGGHHAARAARAARRGAHPLRGHPRHLQAAGALWHPHPARELPRPQRAQQGGAGARAGGRAGGMGAGGRACWAGRSAFCCRVERWGGRWPGGRPTAVFRLSRACCGMAGGRLLKVPTPWSTSADGEAPPPPPPPPPVPAPAPRFEQVLSLLRRDAAVALVSDAGMPCVNDPGAALVAAAAAAGLPVVPVPGPSSVLAALVGAALPTERFTFAGYTPPKPGARRALFEELRGELACHAYLS